MSKPVYSAIMGYSAANPAIVFVPSAKQTQLTAIDIMSYASAAGEVESSIDAFVVFVWIDDADICTIERHCLLK